MTLEIRNGPEGEPTMFSLQAEIEELEEENGRLENEVYDLTRALEAAEIERDDFESEVDAIRSELDDMESDRDYWLGVAEDADY